jgi:CBS domain-containing protein
MNDAMIGALVVTEGDRVVGIFTERDVLRRVVAAERSPSQTLVGEVMTTSVACCTEDTEIDDARGVMKNRRIRHLPVVGGDGRIVGLISIGDLNAYYAGDQEHTIHMLHDYLYGRM